MKDFHDKVAVITGAASGIGWALSERCAQEGMRIVLADVEEAALAKAEKALRAKGATVLPVLTDVSKIGEVENLAKKTLETFGAVHLLVNNAGVAAGSTVWESTPADWEWVMGVNLLGIIYGLRCFVPLMLNQKTECHIVNNASATGLVGYGLSAPYQIAKHGVVSLSEHLYYSLRERDANVKVSVLCSAWVKTRIMNAGRNRPAELKTSSRNQSSRGALQAQKMRQALQEGMPPREVANQVFQAIENEQFYILTHLAETAPLVRQRMEGILNHQNPPQVTLDDFLFLHREQ